MPPYPTPVLERLCEAIEVDELTGCWNWVGRQMGDTGYGMFAIKEPSGHWRGRYAHRVVYEYFIGSVPEGLELDHLCRNKLCVCPEHLDPVTSAENNRRRLAAMTHCKRGHQFGGDNLYTFVRNGVVTRNCRECRRLAGRRHDARKREARRAAA